MASGFKSRIPNELLNTASTNKSGIVRLATIDEQKEAATDSISSTPSGTFQALLNGFKYRSDIDYPEQCVVVYGYEIYISIRANGPNTKNSETGGIIGAKNPATESDYWINYKTNILSKTSGIPIGGLLYYTSDVAPEGFLPAAGSLLNRIDYQELWGFAQKSGMLVNESDWTTNMGCYSSGDGSNTFRIPYLGGLFIRPWTYGQTYDVNRIKGSLQGDAIRNITGSTMDANGLVVSQSFSGTRGAFRSLINTSNIGYQSGTSGQFGVLDMDASRQVPTATENRPMNIAMPIYIRYL